MISSTSPKKRSLMPSGKLRRALRGHGHRLSAIVQIGKAGVTQGVVKQVEQALADHELIKLRVDADCPADRFAVADDLAERPGVNVVQIIGGAILLYKRDPHRPRYEGRRAQAGEAAETEASPGLARASVKRPRSSKLKPARSPKLKPARSSKPKPARSSKRPDRRARGSR
jgi:RNA-binding protein